MSLVLGLFLVTFVLNLPIWFLMLRSYPALVQSAYEWRFWITVTILFSALGGAIFGIQNNDSFVICIVRGLVSALSSFCAYLYLSHTRYFRQKQKREEKKKVNQENSVFLMGTKYTIIDDEKPKRDK